MKFFTPTLTLSLLASLTTSTPVAKRGHPHAPHHQHPTFAEMSAGIPCVYDCLVKYRHKYDFEAKTQHKICYYENYDASSLLEGKLTDCVVDRCMPEQVEDFQPKSRKWWCDFCGWQRKDVTDETGIGCD